LLILAACSRGGGASTEGFTVDVAISPQPPRVGPAAVTVTLAEAGGRPVEGAKVELEGDMTHAGMVPVLAEASETAAGRYESTLRLTMAGDWILTVRATLPDGRTIERQVDVPGVKNE
jgi:hypothetical protein